VAIQSIFNKLWKYRFESILHFHMYNGVQINSCGTCKMSKKTYFTGYKSMFLIARQGAFHLNKQNLFRCCVSFSIITTRF